MISINIILGTVPNGLVLTSKCYEQIIFVSNTVFQGTTKYRKLQNINSHYFY